MRAPGYWKNASQKSVSKETLVPSLIVATAVPFRLLSLSSVFKGTNLTTAVRYYMSLE